MLNTHRLERDIEAQMAEARLPGLALAVVRGEEIVYARGFGVTSVEEGAPVTPATLFRIGSVTKPMTGTAVMQMVEEGILDLDAPVAEYLPWLRFSEPGAAGRITLRLLMSHRSGLPWEYEPDGARDPSGLEAWVRERMADYPFIAAPGTLYSYSNPGLNLVGCIAQTASGRPYADLVQERVFDPLEMTRTTFDPLVAMTYPLAQSHYLDEDDRLRVRRRFVDNTGWRPAGYAISNVLDLSRFALAFLHQGRFRDRRLLAPESVAEMHRPHARAFGTTNNHYGLTFSLQDYKGVRRVGHGGAISHYGARLALAPEQELAVAVTINRLGARFDVDALVNRIFDESLDLPAGEPEPETTAPDRARWPCFAGAYLGRYRGLAIIEEADGRLLLTRNGEAIPLQALAGDLYCGRAAGRGALTAVGFVGADQTPARWLMLDGSPCERAELDPSFTPDPSTWSGRAGRYVFENHVLAVRVEDGQLFIGAAGDEKTRPAVALAGDRFACDEGLVEFEPGRDGRAAALVIGRSYRYRRLPDRGAPPASPGGAS